MLPKNKFAGDSNNTRGALRGDFGLLLAALLAAAAEMRPKMLVTLELQD